MFLYFFIELIRYSLSCGIPNPTSFRWNFQVFWWYNYIQNKVIWDPKLTISKWPFWAAKWNTTCLSTLFGLPTPMVVLEPLFLWWFSGVFPFNMWPISSWEENNWCYKLSKCRKWDPFTLWTANNDILVHPYPFLFFVDPYPFYCIKSVWIREGPFPNFFASGILKFRNGTFSGIRYSQKVREQDFREFHIPVQDYWIFRIPKLLINPEKFPKN